MSASDSAQEILTMATTTSSSVATTSTSHPHHKHSSRGSHSTADDSEDSSRENDDTIVAPPVVPSIPLTVNFSVPLFPGGELLRKVNVISMDGNPQTWCILQGPEFKVRTLKYLSSRKKAPSDLAGLNVFAIDLVRCKRRIDHIATHPSNPLRALLNSPTCPQIFIFNHQVMMDSMYLHLLIYATLPDVRRLSDKANLLLQQFQSSEMSDATRNSILKIIPSVVVGPWLAKKAVGNKPALVGTKLSCKYFRGPKYFEICMDVGSTSVGTAIISVINKYVKSLVVDIAFLLEGKSEAQLPEQLLAGIRLFHCDLEFLMKEVPLWDPL
ncbi:lipid binding protein [Pelomyxa schiedti]|nr:lipid binding protein [Pelomyxa schiedti]